MWGGNCFLEGFSSTKAFCLVDNAKGPSQRQRGSTGQRLQGAISTLAVARFMLNWWLQGLSRTSHAGALDKRGVLAPGAWPEKALL